MGQHLRGKLGPAGRIELVRLMREDGLTERAAAAALSVDCSSLVGARARGQSGRAGVAVVGAGSLQPAAAVPAPDAC
jgi:hypothetical protein